MRISTRLLVNAVTNYARLGLTFVVGILFTWYVIGQVGLVGFGAVSMAAGSFGLASTIIWSARHSVTRELSAAIASGEPARIERTLASALVLTAVAALVLAALFAILAGLAGLGVFRVPAGEPGLRFVLAALFGVEGLIAAAYVLLSPWVLAPFASQRVGLDNLLIVAERLVSPIAAGVAFGVLRPEGTLTDRLFVFVVLRGALGVAEIVAAAVVGRLVVPSLRLRVGAFDRGELRTIAGTLWHTGQVILAAGVTPHLLMLFVNLVFGLAYNGMWQVVIQIGGHVRMISTGLLRGIDPLAAHLQERGDRATVAHLMTRVVRYQLILVLPLATTYAIFMTPILYLWIGNLLTADERLVQTGIGADETVALVAIMGTINLLGQLCFASTTGMERMLFGLGRVRSYAWFAKWSLLVTVVAAALLMWLMDSPVGAVIPLAVMQFVQFCIIVPRATARELDLPVRETLLRALPRPLVISVLLAVPVTIARLAVPEPTLEGLAALALGFGAVHLALGLALGLEAGERRRLREMIRAARGRRAGAGSP